MYCFICVRMAVRNTSDKLADHPASGIMNIFRLSNTNTQIRHSQNAYFILGTHLVPATYRGYTSQLVKEGKHMNSWGGSYIYSEMSRNNQINEESTAGSSNTYDVVTQHQSDLSNVTAHCSSTAAVIRRPNWPQSAHRSTTTTILSARYANIPKYYNISRAYSIRVVVFR